MSNTNKIRPFPKPNGRMPHDDVTVTRSWKRFRVDSFGPSLDTNLPPLYKGAVIAERSDGVVFTVPVLIKKSAFDMVPHPKKALDIAMQMIQEAVLQIDTFRDCDCQHNAPCEKHQ